jgi:hypothetical protein
MRTHDTHEATGETTGEERDVVVNDIKVQKRLSTSLTAGGSKLIILAQQKANNTATVHVTITDLKTKKAQRGMTRRFDSFASAVEALRDVERDAQKKGWTRTERSGGFKARPDAFTSIPTPPKGKK